MLKPVIRMLASDISHMPLLAVWRDSGVCARHGFALELNCAQRPLAGQPLVTMDEGGRRLLDGSYDFLSGLHHEPYHLRATGDKRMIYLAQAQNDWDDRIVATQEIRTAKDLEGRRIVASSTAPCVFGNLKHTLELGGADLSKVEIVTLGRHRADRKRSEAVDMVARGEAAAAAVDTPYDLRGEKAGLHRLETPSVPVIHNCTICANGEWTKENEESTLAFLRSMVDAIHFFKTEKQKSCEIIERELSGPLELQGADEIEHLHEVWAGLLSPKPFPHPLAVWNVYNLDVAHDPAVNFIGPFDLWSTSYLRDIDDGEYIDELYGGPSAAANPPVTVAI